MKTTMIILFMLSAIFVGFDAQGQIVLPDDNPKTTLIQDLGFNRISVEYNRPSTEGHIIFGERVPYGETWLDDNRTYMQFSVTGKLLIEGEYNLEAGNYFLSAIPGSDVWTIIIRKGIPGRDPAFGWADPSIYSLDKMSIFRPGEEVFRFNVKAEKLCEKMESLTVQFANVCSTCVRMQIMWDYTRVAFNVTTEVDGEILDEIETFTNNPELKLAGQYYLAAKYYLDTNRDLDKALEWVDKSLSYTPDAYWVLHTKAEILAAMGDYKEAMDVAESSMEIARAKNDQDYVRINEMEIKRWKELRKSGM